MATGSYLSVITLNVNGLNAPTKRQRLDEWIPHLGLCPGPNVPLQGPQGSQVCIPDSPSKSLWLESGRTGLKIFTAITH